jgi:phage terminase large subunit
MQIKYRRDAKIINKGSVTKGRIDDAESYDVLGYPQPDTRVPEWPSFSKTKFQEDCPAILANKKEVMLGIDIMKRYVIHITSRSVNMIKEFKNYKFIEDKNGNILNKPVDMFNHTIDPVRYICYNKKSKPNYGKYAVR